MGKARLVGDGLTKCRSVRLSRYSGVVVGIFKMDTL